MSLRNRLILTTVSVSLSLFLVTILIFTLIVKHHMDKNVEQIYGEVLKTYTFAQKAVAKSAGDVSFELPECSVRRASTYITFFGNRLLVGRVENCKFYGTDFLKVLDFTVSVKELNWLIIYDRYVLERLGEKEPEFFDRFIAGKTVLDDSVIEGKYSPDVLQSLQISTGYRLINGFKTLVIDVPIVVDNSIPVGRVVFVKDFSETLRELIFTPLVFLFYTFILVVALSTVLFLMFNRLVSDITMLKNMAYRFKELDFSDIPKLNEHLRKEKTRDELFTLKRSVLTMAQELEVHINQLKSEKEKFEELAYRDPLTGLNNRRFFEEEAKALIDLSKRYKEPLSLILMDIDNFKRINDEYGHDVGDLVLKQLAEVIRKNLRSSDISARFGGEEFIVLLPKTDDRGAFMVAERIRKDFRNSSVKVNGKEIWTTVSLGISILEEGDDLETLIKKADSALYEAKREGKDRVVVFKYKEEGQGQG
ncbi:diguanylate cyclase (GGDEF)-like protein [Hydrogenivirga caldilitoris]|uniref:diguanylate cyclase n=2 Tax=Hydrogenivirga caldilitoris TaxID=246264 RepID=A0A497XPJ5_9AQUI|nr:diguanylate cyclase (GGDEF)-like protein [Hydrogenivirga caldilitoris]